jgi:ADP-ribose pyrophosphatase YjhB (NUDIX family)
MSLDWFDIAKRLKAISQAGRFFAKNEYELNRHLEIEDICARIVAEYSGENPEQVKYLLQQDSGYPTPKVDCRGVCFRDNKILLVREVEDGLWTLPGGWCDQGLTPAQNCEREIWEESGFTARSVRLLAVYDRDHQGHAHPYLFSIYKLFFLCEITGGEAKPSVETSEVAFFGEHEIPPLSQGRTLPRQIARFFEQYRDPSLPVDFD